jgi:hypothetical protein
MRSDKSPMCCFPLPGYVVPFQAERVFMYAGGGGVVEIITGSTVPLLRTGLLQLKYGQAGRMPTTRSCPYIATLNQLFPCCVNVS